MFGIPRMLKSDNGPPFNGLHFKKFCEEMNVIYHKVTPYWPEANGLAERSVKTFKKLISTAKLENKDIQKELDMFLLNYRATPHTTTGKSPFEIVFSRNVKTTIPAVIDSKPNEEMEFTNQQKKSKQKEYADKKRHTKPHNFSAGDLVLCKQQKSDKYTTPYEKEPYKITQIIGSQITAENQNKTITRNSSFFKKYNCDNRITSYPTSYQYDNPSTDAHETYPHYKDLPTVVKEKEGENNGKNPDSDKNFNKCENGSTEENGGKEEERKPHENRKEESSPRGEAEEFNEMDLSDTKMKRKVLPKRSTRGKRPGKYEEYEV